MTILRAGIIGLGKITQIKHLSYLFDSPHYEIAAICDISTDLMEYIAQKYNVAQTHRDYEELLSQQNLDVVFVLTHDHVEPIVKSLEAGFHVFTEKPLCWTLTEAKKIQAALALSNKKLMIGYMKRYIPAYRDIRQHYSSADIKIIHSRTFASGVKGALPASYEIRKDDTNKSLESETQKSIIHRISEEYQFSEEQAKNYKYLLELGIHNLNLIGDFLGSPLEIEYSSFWDSRVSHDNSSSKENVRTHRMYLAVMKFRNDIKLIFEVGAFFDNKKNWDDRIFVSGNDMDYSIKFPNPFIKKLPVIVEKSGILNDTIFNSTETFFFEDAFMLELDSFYQSIVNDLLVETGYEDGRKDMELIIEMVRKGQSS
ncbi:Inositol 2-dehydrogenase [compost metagenome]